MYKGHTIPKLRGLHQFSVYRQLFLGYIETADDLAFIDTDRRQAFDCNSGHASCHELNSDVVDRAAMWGQILPDNKNVPKQLYVISSSEIWCQMQIRRPASPYHCIERADPCFLLFNEHGR